MSDNSQAPVKQTIRLDVELKGPSDDDFYIHVGFLELCRAKEKREQKELLQLQRKDSESASNKVSEDPEADALARYYEEKYGDCNEYAELGEGYDDEDSFIDNSAAINDLLPNGLQAELGGFYINRGKLLLVKDGSSGTESDDDNIRPSKHAVRCVSSDSQEDGKTENGQIFRIMATPRIPAHLLHNKPFQGSELPKNTSEMKKNKLKNVDNVDEVFDGIEQINHKKHQVKVKRVPTLKADLLIKSHNWDDVIESVATGTNCTENGSAAYLHNVDEVIEWVATGADLACTDIRF